MTDGAVRRVKVPSNLVGATNKAVQDWARTQLKGQEADLKPADLKGIKDGSTKEATLRPRKAGFYLPDGSFVEAFDTHVSFGADLDAAEQEMSKEQEDWAWAEKENAAFVKKPRGVKSEEISTTRTLWDHGRRVATYIDQNKRSPHKIYEMLQKRGGSNAYGPMTHETAVSLYKWRPNLDEADPINRWSWQVVDVVIRFSSDDSIREAVATLINTHLLDVAGKQQAICDWLRGQSDKKAVWKGDVVLLAEIRQLLKTGRPLDASQVSRLREQIRKASTNS